MSLQLRSPKQLVFTEQTILLPCWGILYGLQGDRISVRARKAMSVGWKEKANRTWIQKEAGCGMVGKRERNLDAILAALQ